MAGVESNPGPVDIEATPDLINFCCVCNVKFHGRSVSVRCSKCKLYAHLRKANNCSTLPSSTTRHYNKETYLCAICLTPTPPGPVPTGALPPPTAACRSPAATKPPVAVAAPPAAAHRSRSPAPTAGKASLPHQHLCHLLLLHQGNPAHPHLDLSQPILCKFFNLTWGRLR